MSPRLLVQESLLKKDLPFVLNSFGGWLNYPEYFFFWAYVFLRASARESLTTRCIV